MLPPTMAVSGPPDNDGSYLLQGCPYSPESSYSQTLDKFPESDSCAHGSVSPCKKRVRISDSTCVRVIDSHEDHVDGYGQSSGYRRRLKFSARSEDGVSHARREHSGESYHTDNGASGSTEEYTEYTQLLSADDDFVFPDDVPLLPAESLHGHSLQSDSSPLLGLSPFRDASNRVRVLSDPQGLNPAALHGAKGTLLVTDLVTGWPLKRSPSLESRDNPFLPGGDLSKEAEELLSKATIVRDKFYLDQERQILLTGLDSQETPSDQATDHAPDVADGTAVHANNGPGVLEARISPATAHRAQAAPEPQPRENGKVKEGTTTGVSADGVKVEVGNSPATDGNKGVNNDIDDEQQDKDKPKRRPKCCVMM